MSTTEDVGLSIDPRAKAFFAGCSPDAAQRNPWPARDVQKLADSAALHPRYRRGSALRLRASWKHKSGTAERLETNTLRFAERVVR